MSQRKSIGAIAVAPSNPNIIYVASGEGLHRPRPFRRQRNLQVDRRRKKPGLILGLRDGLQIPALAVDPRDPNKIFAAVLGHPYGPNEERGLFRSTDGGLTWPGRRLFTKTRTPEASGVEIDSSNPDVIYASMWEAREGPWEDNNMVNGAGGGLFQVQRRRKTPGVNLPTGCRKILAQINVAITPSGFPA